MKILLLVGNDKIGRKLLNEIDLNRYVIAIDKSTSYKRVLKLIKKKVISFSLVVKIFIAELFRRNYKTPYMNKFYEVKNNNDLLEIIEQENIDLVVIFRGGLIVNKQLLNKNIDILNIHCAKLPEYGGIGVIQRALDNKDYNQEATLYKITEKIDDGEIIATKSYMLNPNKSYMYNENLAYNTGINLFKEFFDNV